MNNYNVIYIPDQLVPDDCAIYRSLGQEAAIDAIVDFYSLYGTLEVINVYKTN